MKKNEKANTNRKEKENEESKRKKRTNVARSTENGKEKYYRNQDKNHLKEKEE